MNALDFIRESNRIKNIHREPTAAEIGEFRRFMGLPMVTVQDLQHFVSAYQPGAKLRTLRGMNVIVGNHRPPRGGPDILLQLGVILNDLWLKDPYETHLAYESLHPFSNCNGRSGRMIWAWQMKAFPLGFLHQFYYQALTASRSLDQQ